MRPFEDWCTPWLYFFGPAIILRRAHNKLWDLSRGCKKRGCDGWTCLSRNAPFSPYHKKQQFVLVQQGTGYLKTSNHTCSTVGRETTKPWRGRGGTAAMILILKYYSSNSTWTKTKSKEKRKKCERTPKRQPRCLWGNITIINEILLKVIIEWSRKTNQRTVKR